MEIEFLNTEEKQALLAKLDAILAHNTEKAKKELLKQPVSNEDFIKLMGISSRTAQNWRDKGVIEFYKIGDKIYYTWDSIHKMMETHKVKSFRGL